MELRRIMCSREMNSDARWERLIEAAFYLTLRVPGCFSSIGQALILEAEKRREWWWRNCARPAAGTEGGRT
jgi:hypothetical protein